MSPAQTTEENISKLKAKLRELFQLDRGDLDFGLYRIMAHKSAEVDAFLENDLLPQVTEALGEVANADSEGAGQELAEALALVEKVGGVDPEQTHVVKEARAKLAIAKTYRQMEADTYNHLCKFFARYYDEGDFMSLRRYKAGGRDAYSIPYNGEEVKLHWANADQYYIKTTENYASYIFIVGDGARVRFEVAAADNEKDNIKEANGKQRYFVPSKNFVAEQNGALTVRFDHRPLTEGEQNKHPQNGVKRQASINIDAEQRIRAQLKGDWLDLLCAPCPTEADPARTLLGKHIAAYTTKNSFDYFIHKDLGGFLRRELDAYIKSEVISVDNLRLADDMEIFMRSMAQVKAVKNVGEKIIDFLAQLENFQKQLWLKKKFVLETQYCVTLDQVPESLYSAVAKNKAQRDEWVQLFAIDKLNGGRTDASTAFSKPLKLEFLKENPHLVLDTKHFDQKFTDQLLAALSETSPIDESLNGLLVHGENSQALRLIAEKFGGRVECVHIDPPYNTDTSGFLYKNGYQHSSWMSMMDERIEAAQTLMTDNGAFVCHIDENEYERLKMLFDRLPVADAGTVIWDKRNPMNAGRGVATQHEYMVWRTNYADPLYLLNGNIVAMIEAAQSIVEEHGGVTESARKEFSAWVMSNKSLSGGEKAYRNLDEKGQIFRSVSLRAPEPRTDPKFFEPLIHPVTGKPCPVPPNGFSRTPETLAKMLERGEIIFGKDETVQPRQKTVMTTDSRRQISSLVQDAHKGKADLDKVGLIFPYCHPVSLYREVIGVAIQEQDGIALDFFAGSGTTGHAVVNLNREDDGNRKYILVEIGKHFDDVLLPRMKKVVYSANWKDGKPDGGGGVSQLFKYVRLESYEDSLDSLAVTSRKNLLPAENQAMAEDYQLRYALGEETADNASLVGRDFIDPFNYALSVVRDGVRGDARVDLAETFNFLLGLRLSGRRRIDGVLAITGATRKGENCLILWRDMNKINAAKLDKWFNKHRAVFGDDLHTIYVNGDHTLNALQQPGDKWEAVTTEPVFRRLMFSGAE